MCDILVADLLCALAVIWTPSFDPIVSPWTFGFTSTLVLPGTMASRPRVDVESYCKGKDCGAAGARRGMGLQKPSGQ